jgi:hypothetical protein
MAQNQPRSLHSDPLLYAPYSERGRREVKRERLAAWRKPATSWNTSSMVLVGLAGLAVVMAIAPSPPKVANALPAPPRPTHSEA